MLRSLKALAGYRIVTRDGEIGKAVDFYYDTRTWLIQHFAIQARRRDGRRILVPASADCRVVHGRREILVDMSWQQVWHLRGYELEEAERSGGLPDWPCAWAGEPLLAGGRFAVPEPVRRPGRNSAMGLVGSRVDGIGGKLGYVSDLIADEEGWRVRHLAVDVGSWFRPRCVEVATEWVEGVSEGTVRAMVTRASVGHGVVGQVAWR
jgi:hypothetical protein